MRNGEKEIPGGRWPHVLGWTHRNRVPLTRESKRLLSWRAISKAVVAGESWWSGSRSCPALTVRGRFHGPPGRKDSACRLAEQRLLVNSARREPRRLGRMEFASRCQNCQPRHRTRFRDVSEPSWSDSPRATGQTHSRLPRLSMACSRHEATPLVVRY